MKEENYSFFVNISTSTDLKRRVKMLPFHYVSSARKSNLLEQSGGGGSGGGGVCRPIKVMRTRFYPEGHLPRINICL